MIWKIFLGLFLIVVTLAVISSVAGGNPTLQEILENKDDHKVKRLTALYYEDIAPVVEKLLEIHPNFRPINTHSKPDGIEQELWEQFLWIKDLPQIS